MTNYINTLGHKVSAVAGSYIHARSKSAAIVRTVTLGTFFSGMFLVSTMNLAHANGALATYAGEVSNRTSVIVDIVGYVCYLGGAVLSALGVVDLKKHVEQPAQNPIKNGLAKLGFGGMLLFIPFLSGIMMDTMKGSQQQAEYRGFTRGGMRIQP